MERVRKESVAAWERGDNVAGRASRFRLQLKRDRGISGYFRGSQISGSKTAMVRIGHRPSVFVKMAVPCCRTCSMEKPWSLWLARRNPAESTHVVCDRAGG